MQARLSWAPGPFASVDSFFHFIHTNTHTHTYMCIHIYIHIHIYVCIIKIFYDSVCIKVNIFWIISDFILTESMDLVYSKK